MKPKSKSLEIFKSSAEVKAIVVGASICTLYFNPGIQDPFNPPKFWVLMLTVAYVSSLYLIRRRSINTKNFIFIKVILAVFIIGSLISALLTDDKYVSFFGDTQRKTGFFAYSCLVLLLFYSAAYVKFIDSKFIYRVVLVVGSISSIYGLMQNFGKDFVSWNNPYNSVITTLGNPNFSSAVMAILLVLIFGAIFEFNNSNIFKFFSIVAVILLLLTIFLSHARQGLISAISGVAVIVTVKLFSKSIKIGLVALIGLILSIILTILGMLQIGPLSSYLYKSSVSIRGYYWRAGLEMFKDHFWFGVGLDRYGDYFKFYREASYPLNYGYNITSTNAHNVPIQLFATGGVFVGLAYLLIVGFIFLRGIIGIVNSSNQNRLFFSTIFSAWVAFQAQSIVSIDNLGIAVWGWVLGGMVIGMSYTSNLDEIKTVVKNQQIRNTNQTFQPLVSTFLVGIFGVLCIYLYKGEAAMMETRRWFNPQESSNFKPFEVAADKATSTWLLDPSYKVDIGAYLVAMGKVEKGLSLLEAESLKNKRNLDALNILANYNEQLSRIDRAINFRIKISLLDPWNAENLFSLGKDYKAIGNYSEMEKIRLKILKIAPRTQIASNAVSELA